MRGGSDNLSFSSQSVQLFWFGFRGLRCESMLHRVSQLRSSFPVPDILILHVGGNDVGRMQTLLLLAELKRLFLLLQHAFPRCCLVFSEVIPRLRWSLPEERFFDKIRKRLNRAMMVFLRSVGGFSYRHTLLEGFEPGLFRADKVHLSDIGLDIFNCDVEEMVEKAAARWWVVMPA